MISVTVSLNDYNSINPFCAHAPFYLSEFQYFAAFDAQNRFPFNPFVLYPNITKRKLRPTFFLSILNVMKDVTKAYQITHPIFICSLSIMEISE